MGRLRNGKHDTFLVNLKRADVSVNGIKREITYRPEDCSDIGADLIDAVRHTEKEKGAKHCPGCGRIAPELAVRLGGRLYRFMCYEIADALTDRVFASMDYEKFCEFQREQRAKHVRYPKTSKPS